MNPNHRLSDHDSSPESNLPAYALGALSPEEADEVARHVSSDSDAARELDSMLETVAAVGMNIGVQEPPESLRQVILNSVDADVSARRVHASASVLAHIQRQIETEESQDVVDNRKWYDRVFDSVTVSKLAFATSLAALMIAVIVAVQLGSDNAALNRRVAEASVDVQASTDYANMVLRELDEARAALSEAQVMMQQQAARIESMSASSEMMRNSFNDQISLTYATLQRQYQAPDWLPDSSAYSGGYGYILEDRYAPEATLVVGGASPAPPGQEYRLYLTSGDSAVHVASFNMNRVGYGTVSFGIPAPLSRFDGAHITIESITEPPDPTLAEPANRYRPQ